MSFNGILFKQFPIQKKDSKQRLVIYEDVCQSWFATSLES